ncbi:MAG: ribosome maturation factor RimM [Bacilli bacterium]
MSKSKDELIEIGQIVGVFGIKGELKVASESDFIDYRFRVGAKVIFSNKIEYTITSSRIHKGKVLITINDIYDINQVLEFVGMKIYALKSDVPPINENEYYVESLIDLDVYNTDNLYLGKVTDVIEIPSGYIIEIIDEKNKRFLMPFVDEYVKAIDDEKMIIQEIEGLRS